MTHKRFKFKSSGRKVTDHEFTEVVPVEQPIGLITPLKFSGKSSAVFYSTHVNPKDQIKDNLKNLILTNWGDRLGRSSFGANLIDLTFEYGANDKFEAEAMLMIINATKKHIPAVSIKEIKVIEAVNPEIAFIELSGDSLGLALITLRVSYDIPRLKSFNQFLEVLVFVGG